MKERIEELLTEDAVEDISQNVEAVWATQGTEAARKYIVKWLQKYNLTHLYEGTDEGLLTDEEIVNSFADYAENTGLFLREKAVAKAQKALCDINHQKDIRKISKKIDELIVSIICGTCADDLRAEEDAMNEEARAIDEAYENAKQNNIIPFQGS